MSKAKQHTREKPDIVFSEDGGWECIPNRVIRCPHLAPGPKLLLFDLMAYCHGPEKRTCFPSQETLASNHGVSERTIRNWLVELEAAGLVEMHQRGLGKSNVYTIADRCFADWQPASGPDQQPASGSEQKVASGPVGKTLPGNSTNKQYNMTVQQQHVPFGDNGGGGAHTPSSDQEALIQDLMNIGMNGSDKIVSQYDNDCIRRWLEYVRSADGQSLHNPAGFVRQQLMDGNEAPELKVEEESTSYSI